MAKIFVVVFLRGILVATSSRLHVQPKQANRTHFNHDVLQDHLTVMTWNVENVGRIVTEQHLSFVVASLKAFVAKYKSDVIALQEIESCSYIAGSLPSYSCVESVVSETVESRRPGMVLGGLLLFKTAVFEAAYENRILSDSTWKKHISIRRDRGGMTLSDRHTNECTWAPYNGCHSPHPDIPKTNTVELSLRKGFWNSNLSSSLKGGIRMVNVHLFAGGHMHSLTEKMRADRRSFQMRALLWLTDLWNSASGAYGTPTTFYVGDYNTRGENELRRVVHAAKDYGVDLWCPADHGRCADVASRHRTHRAGYLDHIVVDLRSHGAHRNLGVKAAVLQQKGTKLDGQSDHSPLLLKITAQATDIIPPASTLNIRLIAIAAIVVLCLLVIGFYLCRCLCGGAQ